MSSWIEVTSLSCAVLWFAGRDVDTKLDLPPPAIVKVLLYCPRLSVLPYMYTQFSFLAARCFFSNKHIYLSIYLHPFLPSSPFVNHFIHLFVCSFLPFCIPSFCHSLFIYYSFVNFLFIPFVHSVNQSLHLQSVHLYIHFPYCTLTIHSLSSP